MGCVRLTCLCRKAPKGSLVRNLNPEVMTHMLQEKELFVPSPPPPWSMVYQMWSAPITKFWTFQVTFPVILAFFGGGVKKGAKGRLMHGFCQQAHPVRDLTRQKWLQFNFVPHMRCLQFQWWNCCTSCSNAHLTNIFVLH